MAIREAYDWRLLVAGAYVYDLTGTPWLLLEEHPQQPGTFLAQAPDGRRTVLRDPGKPVRAAVPDHDQALAVLRRVLNAKEESP